MEKIGLTRFKQTILSKISKTHQVFHRTGRALSTAPLLTLPLPTIRCDFAAALCHICFCAPSTLMPFAFHPFLVGRQV